jgi:hypothetical protein
LNRKKVFRQDQQDGQDVACPPDAVDPSNPVNPVREIMLDMVRGIPRPSTNKGGKIQWQN